MDESKLNRKDAATDTSELQGNTASSTISISTETSFPSGNSYDPATDRIDKENEFMENLAPAVEVAKGTTLDFSTSASTLSSMKVNLVLKREAATSTDKLTSEFSISTASTMTKGSSNTTSEMEKETIITDSEEKVRATVGSLEKTKGREVRFSESETETITTGPDEATTQLAASVLSTKFQHLKSKINDKHDYDKDDNDDDDDDDDDDNDLMDSTNLRTGHVFVYMLIPPDGGYGWIISFISFLSQIVVDGIIFSIGIILPFIAKDFNTSDSNVILIASMQIGFYYLSGTVASAFINKYGFRPVAFAGGLFSIIVLTISTFSINLPMMILFYSVLGGPALSMIWVSSQLVIGYYFDRYRPIANGAACSGAGVGIMLFSYMNGVLIPVFGWRNLMRLHVGFLAIVLIMTLAYFEVAPTRIGRVQETLDEDDTESDSNDTYLGSTAYSRYSIKINGEEIPLDDQFETIIETDVIKDQKPVATHCNQCFKICCCFITKYFEGRRIEEDPAKRRYIIKQDFIDKHDLYYSGPKDYETEQLENLEDVLQKPLTLRPSKNAEASRWTTISLEEIDNKFKKQAIINTLSQRRIVSDDPQPRKYRQTYAELKLSEKYPLLAFLAPRNWLHPKIQKAFSLLFDFRLLAVMEFRILLLAALLFPMGFNIPLVYSTVRAQIDASFAMLITPSIGFSNFAFRIASGFVAYKFREYTTYICGGGMFFGGFAVLVSAFYGLDVAWFQFLYAFCYGIAPAFYSTLRAIIYVQALGLDKLTNAFGLTALAMGLGVFIGTTAGGILNDLTGNYTASFIFAGFCICTAGALKLLLPYFIKFSKHNEGK